MKTILLFMCLLVASMAHATEYVIAKTNNVTTVYIIEDAGENSEFVNAYVLTPKPTILELQEIGLPAELWPILDQGCQVYDTRLVKSILMSEELRGKTFELQDTVNELNAVKTALYIWLAIFVVIAFVLLAAIVLKR